jgi:hypothetical protein
MKLVMIMNTGMIIRGEMEPKNNHIPERAITNPRYIGFREYLKRPSVSSLFGLSNVLMLVSYFANLFFSRCAIKTPIINGTNPIRVAGKFSNCFTGKRKCRKIIIIMERYNKWGGSNFFILFSCFYS